MSFELFLGNDNLVELVRLKNRMTGLFVNDAVMSLTIKDAADQTLAGPLTMDSVPGTDGEYQVVVPGATALVERASTFAEITVSAPFNGYWRKPFLPQVRKE